MRYMSSARTAAHHTCEAHLGFCLPEALLEVLGCLLQRELTSAHGALHDRVRLHRRRRCSGDAHLCEARRTRNLLKHNLALTCKLANLLCRLAALLLG